MLCCSAPRCAATGATTHAPSRLFSTRSHSSTVSSIRSKISGHCGWTMGPLVRLAVAEHDLHRLPLDRHHVGVGPEVDDLISSGCWALSQEECGGVGAPSGGRPAPAHSRRWSHARIGNHSTADMISFVSPPAGTLPGHRTITGAHMPPSKPDPKCRAMVRWSRPSKSLVPPGCHCSIRRSRCP